MPPVISTIVMLRLFVRRQRASMSAYFTKSLTPPTGLGLLGVAPRWAFSRSGSAWLGRSQKDGLPTCRGGHALRFKAINSRTGGSPVAAPFYSGASARREWTPRRETLPCSPPCRSSAQDSPGVGDLFGARSSRDFWRSREALAPTWASPAVWACITRFFLAAPGRDALCDGLTFPQFAQAYLQAAKHGHSNGRNKPSRGTSDRRPTGARNLFGRGV